MDNIKLFSKWGQTWAVGEEPLKREVLPRAAQGGCCVTVPFGTAGQCGPRVLMPHAGSAFLGVAEEGGQSEGLRAQCSDRR